MKTESSNPENDRQQADGLVKVDRDTPLETFFAAAGCFMLIWFIGQVWRGVFELFLAHHHPPDSRLLCYAAIPLLGAVVFFTARFWTDNYYLVDPKEHRVFYHFKFLWYRRQRLLLDRADILAVTTKGRRGASLWEYRVLLVGASGRKVPLTNWTHDGLRECNAQAAKIAQMLDCQYYKSPPSCEARIRVKDGAASITFVPLWLGLTRMERWCLASVILILAICLLIIWRSGQIG